jgi:hypothetical protein
MTELERLQKEINGKVVWWKSDKGYLLHAICIWPPYGDQISVKPYGHTPEEIQKVEHWTSLEDIKKPTHCLTRIRAALALERGRIDIIEHLANVPDGCVYNSFKTDNHGTHPSCPYG